MVQIFLRVDETSLSFSNNLYLRSITDESAG